MKATSLPALFRLSGRPPYPTLQRRPRQEKRGNSRYVFPAIVFCAFHRRPGVWTRLFSSILFFHGRRVSMEPRGARRREKTPREKEPEETCFSCAFSVSMRSCFQPRSARSIFQRFLVTPVLLPRPFADRRSRKKKCISNVFYFNVTL